ncbi:MAG: hypothetical protein IME99_00630 [Proteobacteria bacterium]|nr:hypothetical protein [Pseudomonadota bacterium]
MYKKFLFIILILATLGTLSGCTEPDYKAENRALMERVGELSEENIELLGSVATLEEKLEYFSAEAERLEAERNALAIELKSLKSKLNTKSRRRR